MKAGAMHESQRRRLKSTAPLQLNKPPLSRARDMVCAMLTMLQPSCTT